MKPLLYTLSLIIMSLINLFAGGDKKLTPQQIQDTSVYDFTMSTLDGQEKNLADYKGKVLVIVNTASKCGLTPQYESLEKFYQEYKDRGVEVLGFPANNFMKQEPGTDEQIAEFCQKNYGVSFPMFSKISVKGKSQAPLYQYLTAATGDTVKWNFQKYIIDRNGKVVASISPRQTIYDPKSIEIIEQYLGNE